MALLNAADVAIYFLARQSTTPTGERIDNVKLQRLCYYAQGFALARLNTPLFFDRIEHRESGPIIPVLWRNYTRYGHGYIPMPQPLVLQSFSADTKGVLNEVYENYDSLEANAMAGSTGTEPPWASVPTGAPITHQKIQSYFREMLGKFDTSSGNGSAGDEEFSSVAQASSEAAS